MAYAGRLRPLVRRRAGGRSRRPVRGGRRRPRGGLDRFLDYEPEHRRVEIGWTWLRPSAWGTGANVETKLLLLEHAFERCGLQRVEFKTDARNERTRGALLALGGAVRGDLPQAHDAADGPARLGVVRDHRGRLAGGEGAPPRRLEADEGEVTSVRGRCGGDPGRAARRRRAGDPGAPAASRCGSRSAAAAGRGSSRRTTIPAGSGAGRSRRARASCRRRPAAEPLELRARLPRRAVRVGRPDAPRGSTARASSTSPSGSPAGSSRATAWQQEAAGVPVPARASGRATSSSTATATAPTTSRSGSAAGGSCTRRRVTASASSKRPSPPELRHAVGSRPSADRPAPESRDPSKAASRRADTGHVDAAQREEILTRYREHSRRFQTVAARRHPAADADRVPAAPDRPGARAPPDRARDRGPPARLGGPREPRDRRPALPLRGDGQEPRPPSAGEAAGSVKSPRRGRWLPAWAPDLDEPKQVFRSYADNHLNG